MPKRTPNTQNKEANREAALQRALKDVKAGMSQHEASRQHGVPRSTLRDRIHGAQDRQAAHKHEQLLSPSEENEIVAWCAEMQRRFLPVRLSYIRAYAETILRARAEPGDEIIVGEHWVDRFRARHPELQVTTSKQIDQKRVMAKNPTNIMDFYVMLANLFQKYDIPPSRRFNCDEKGWQLGITGQEKVLVLRRDPDERRDGYAGGSKQSGSRETITTIDTIGGSGVVLPPFIIMKGKYVLDRWSADSPLPPSTRWSTSPNGWTDNELGVEYIQAFDEWTKEYSVNQQWRCLILDGHGSHLTFGFLKYAIDTRIIVVSLPSHTTDFLQPLDRALFRPLQHAYSKEVRRRMQLGQTVTKDTFARVLHIAREEAYTEKNIKSAFEATGISPLNPWRTDVMAKFRKEMQSGRPGANSTVSPAIKRQRAQARYLDLVDNPNATLNELRDALVEASATIDGREARIAILESELVATREMYNERQKRTLQSGRGRRVGQARVYTQEEIRKLAEKKAEERETASARGRGRGKGVVRGVGRGRGRGGRTQNRGRDAGSAKSTSDSTSISEVRTAV